MKQLKKSGMSSTGLCNFYCANIRSVLSYGAPVFLYHFLSDTTKSKVEHVQDTATRIIFPHRPYCDRLDMLDLISLDDLIIRQSTTHFSKVANSCAHPLHDRIIFYNSRRSSRCHTVFRPKIAKTEKRNDSFFTFYE